MDDLKAQHERYVGDQVIRYFNESSGTHFVFAAQPEEAPDLIYRDGDRTIGVEVATCYYDQQDAVFKWKGARGAPDAPRQWAGVNFDEALIESIQRELDQKCGYRYGKNTVLVISVLPSLTRAEELQDRLSQLRIPAEVPFLGIFLYGELPSIGGEVEKRCFRLV